jgi:hypothetical protein
MGKQKVLNQVRNSPSSIFNKEDVINLIEQVDVENQLNIEEFLFSLISMSPMEELMGGKKQPYMMSLYDYLGRAAGKQLGAEVWTTATKLQEVIEERPISNPKFTGNVHLYRREFLDEYFGNKVYEGEVKPSL